MVPNIVTYKTNEGIKKHREDGKNSQDVLFLVIQSSFSIKNKIM